MPCTMGPSQACACSSVRPGKSAQQVLTHTTTTHNAHTHARAHMQETAPTVSAIKAQLAQYAARGVLEYYLDLHAHANRKGVFIYGNALQGEEVGGVGVGGLVVVGGGLGGGGGIYGNALHGVKEAGTLAYWCEASRRACTCSCDHVMLCLSLTIID